jgi:DNA-directed RNA polymerase subunit RPC12/RpoP
MPGWLDWFEDEIICPNCGFNFIVLFCEDGDTSCFPPIVKCFIADENVICPKCSVKISDYNLLNDVLCE